MTGEAIQHEPSAAEVESAFIDHELARLRPPLARMKRFARMADTGCALMVLFGLGFAAFALLYGGMLAVGFGLAATVAPAPALIGAWRKRPGSSRMFFPGLSGVVRVRGSFPRRSRSASGGWGN